ncbi:MAG: Gfo/Idh/MocA family protein [Planctomycetia bacterium]
MSRRSLCGRSLAASAAALLPFPLPAAGVFTGGAPRLRVGLVGCGGRGTGAALQCLESEPTATVVALGDLFADQLGSSADLLERAGGRRFDCPVERRFVGSDAYRGVIDSGVDVVLLAGPPHVRPLHLEAAVAAGKHVYCERPVAVDVDGVVRAAAAAAASRAAGLALVSGFCFRRDRQLGELAARVRDGGIGRLLSARAHAAIGLPWRRSVEDASASSRAIRNWISYTRFSGGYFVEHHAEALDRLLWLFGDERPVAAEPLWHGPSASSAPGGSAPGRGDRVARPIGGFGDCQSGVAVRYHFADGATLEASIDRRERARDHVVEDVSGTEGRCDLLGRSIAGRTVWAAGAAPRPNRHRAAVTALLEGVVSGRHPHDGRILCQSTLVAVMGRHASETGSRVAWEEFVTSPRSPA